jgi:hypothetical protein
LVFPDDSQDVLHALGAPQEVEHTQVHDHALRGEHLENFFFLIVVVVGVYPMGPTSCRSQSLKVQKMDFAGLGPTGNRTYRKWDPQVCHCSCIAPTQPTWRL